MAAKYNEIVNYCLDAVKSTNGDSDITEDHVLFLINQYRLFLLEQKKLKQGVHSLSSANEQTICIDLEPTQAIKGLDYCNDLYLKSVQEIPDLMDGENLKIEFAGMFNIKTAFISKERFKYTGFNKYLKNIIYYTLGGDNHIYVNSANPQFKYLKQLTLTGIFEDAKKAAELSCTDNSETNCDIMELDFPLEADLIPQLLELVNKELLGINYRPKDDENDDADNLAEIANFVRRNLKSPLAKQMTE